MIINIKEISTPMGVIVAGSTQKGICLLEYSHRVDKQIKNILKNKKLKIQNNQNQYITTLEEQLKEYFNKQRKNFDVPLDIYGTPFQKEAWNALLKIPYAQTISYQDQAISIHKPKATRAVANANGANNISILIPCHRVIGKNGNLRGYGGGLDKKEFLLNLEKSTPTP